MNSYKYPQNADDLVSRILSLFQTVLLSYYKVSHCSLLIKSLSNCLIQATYYNRSTHRYMVATVIRQALRQYIELCLNTRTLTQLGLQVPIKTIRQ